MIRFLLALLLTVVSVPAADVPSAVLAAFDAEFTRVDRLVAQVSDSSVSAASRAHLQDFQTRAAKLRRDFDPIACDELRFDLSVVKQRLHAWLRDPAPPFPSFPAFALAPTPATTSASARDTIAASLTPASAPSNLATAQDLPAFASVETFIERHCAKCHNDVDREGRLDLTALKSPTADPAAMAAWIRVHDRVTAGEMPPPERKRPLADELTPFLHGLAAHLIATERERVARDGRSTQRRLNRDEYENALRDLLQAPWLQIKSQLPEDGESHRFNKVGDALDVSFVQMSRYLSAADYAIRQAMTVELVRPPTTTTRYYARDQRTMIKFSGQPPDRLTFPLLGLKPQPEVRARTAPLTAGPADPPTRDLEALGMVSSNYSTGFSFRWDQFRAPVAGRYRIRFSGQTLWVGPFGKARDGQGMPPNRVSFERPREWFWPNFDDVAAGRRDESITVYAKGPAASRPLGAFNLTPEVGTHELVPVWLDADESIAPDATRFYRSRPAGRPLIFDFTNPLAQRDGMPGVAFRWMEIEGPIYDEDTAAGYRLIFGDLELRRLEKGKRGVLLDLVKPGPMEITPRGVVVPGAPDRVPAEVVTADSARDTERLLRAFVTRAFRRPAVEEEIQQFLALVRGRLASGLSFAEAMIAGYTAVLTSPGFLFLEETPGPLDDHALASRLAFFLWNSEPDAALRSRVARGELRQPAALRAETERILGDPKARRFVGSFLDYWLDIRKIEDTSPSITLYPDYALDDALMEAALDETRLFFNELVRENLPARHLVDSDFTFANERLAAHYGLPVMHGVAMRRVALPPGSPRGGLLTQASILKVTANGTTTSPVIRGHWINERILGQKIPPPPPVAAVEPDIRGAVTIREQLARHRADPSCASCHSKMDPPGFALESFDIFGGWRDRYRASSPEQPSAAGFGKNGHPFIFHHGLPVDASGELPDGRAFKDIRDFKRLLLETEAQETQIARNLVQQLTVFATGAPVRFADRAAVEEILRQTRASRHGVRDLIHALVQSELFLNK